MKKGTNYKKRTIGIIAFASTIIIGVSIFLVSLKYEDICYNHRDFDKDMACDKCRCILPYTDYVKHTSLQSMINNKNIILEGNMIDGANLEINEIDKSKYINDAQNAFGEDFIDVVNALDIKIMSNGKKYNPSIYNQTININYDDKNINSENNYAVLHIKENGETEILNTNFANNCLNFKTTSFSAFLVVQVAGKSVSFNGENYKVYDTSFNEITDGTEVASNTNFEFLVLANEGYGIVAPTETDSNISLSGPANVKKYIIKSVTEDMEIDISTALAPQITMQPQAVKTMIRDAQTLQVTAENATSYQWQVKTTHDGPWQNAAGTGSTSRSFKPNVDQYSGYEYRCLVGNSTFDGDDRIVTDTVLVVVVADLTLTYEAPVIISQSASNQKVKIGEGQAIYEVTARGKDLTFTWQYRNGIDGYWQTFSSSLGTVKNTTISNENDVKTITSTLTTVVANNSFLVGEFRCLVGNNYYRSDEAIKSDEMLYLAVYDDNVTKYAYKKIDFTNQPKSQKILIGEIAEFNAEAEGADTYKWQYKKSQDGTWTDVDSKMETDFEIATGYDTETLKINTNQINFNEETQMLDNNLSGYLFRCLVSNSVIPNFRSESDHALLICAKDSTLSSIAVNRNIGVITLMIPNQNGKTGKELLIIDSINSVEVDLEYLGELISPAIEVSCYQKIGDTENYEILEEISEYITVYNVLDSENLLNQDSPSKYVHENIQETEKYQITFLDTLSKGKYRIKFELRGITGEKVAAQALIFEVK